MKPLPSRLAAAVLLSAALMFGGEAEAQAQSESQAQSGSQTQGDSGMQTPTRVIGGPLANVQVVQMSVAPLSDPSRSCGFDSDQIMGAFQQPLAQQGIVVQRAAHVWIQMQVTTVRYEGDVCISYIEARAVQNTRYFDRKTETERSGRVLLWSQGGLFVTGATNHAATTEVGWRDLARGFMRKWEMDQ